MRRNEVDRLVDASLVFLACVFSSHGGGLIGKSGPGPWPFGLFFFLLKETALLWLPVVVPSKSPKPERPPNEHRILITSFIVVIAPGTGVLYTLAYGLSRGAVGSIYAAIGCTFGIVPHLLSAILGLAALLHASALAFQIVKFAGVAYLLYMAWGALREKGALAVERKVDTRTAREIIVKGALINILNPKLSMFFLAFLPQFVSETEAGAAWKMVGLGGVFMAMTLAVFVVYGLFAAAVRDRVVTKPAVMAWVRRLFAGAFVALGAKLALADR